MKRFTLRQRFQYWFDNKMSKGAGSMIRLLAVATGIFVVLLAMLMCITHAQEEGGFFAAVWDSLSYTINAWMPSYGDGSPVYVCLLAIAGIIGLFVTSVLISILTSAMEEKIAQLRQGNSLVLEEGHLVILGFHVGSYELINQLCLSSKERKVIVIASDNDKEEMEQMIGENVDIPLNVKVICRSIDIYDPIALACCSLDTCKAIIINVEEDAQTIRALLAVNTHLIDVEQRPKIMTCMRHNRNMKPAKTAAGGKLYALPMGSIVSRLIAHSCTQPGIAETFMEVFSYRGSEFCFEPCTQLAGKNFSEISLMADNNTPVGIRRGKDTYINPVDDLIIESDDRLLVLSEESGIATFNGTAETKEYEKDQNQEIDMREILIFAQGSSKQEVITELTRNYENARLTIATATEQEDSDSFSGINYLTVNSENVGMMEKILANVTHVILLSDETLSDEEADMKVMILLLRLREIRERMSLTFNITAEMQMEKNKKLVQYDDADFIIASDISSMMLAQVTETPELFVVFSELLSSVGGEFRLIPCTDVVSAYMEVTHASMRKALRKRESVYLGYTTKDSSGKRKVILNPPLHESVIFNRNDGLIVISNNKTDV